MPSASSAASAWSRGRGQSPRGSQASYSGPFRFEAVRIVRRPRPSRSAGRGADAGRRGRLGAAAAAHRLEAAHGRRDGPGRKRPTAGGRRSQGRGRIAGAQTDASAVELELPLALPPRRVKEIASLKGSLQAMVPGKIETFRFADLLTAKNVEKRIAGATVTLEQVRKNNELWEVRMRVRFDDAGNSLESFRGWILQNEAFLEDPHGKPSPTAARNHARGARMRSAWPISSRSSSRRAIGNSSTRPPASSSPPPSPTNSRTSSCRERDQDRGRGRIKDRG